MRESVKVDNGWHGPGWYTAVLSTDGMANEDRVVVWCDDESAMDYMLGDALSYWDEGTDGVARFLGSDFGNGPGDDRMSAYDSYYIEHDGHSFEVAEWRDEHADDDQDQDVPWDGGWERGSVRVGDETWGYVAKVFPVGSTFGICAGRVSKLTIRDEGDRVRVSYDRGWDVEPRDLYGWAALGEVLCTFDGPWHGTEE